jgi:glycolate oxidase FAD binding subunit
MFTAASWPSPNFRGLDDGLRRFFGRHAPPTGPAYGRPDDRLLRGIRYSAQPMFICGFCDYWIVRWSLVIGRRFAPTRWRTMTTESRFNPVDILKVRDAKDVEQAVRAALASEQPLEIIGHGSKRLIGQPMATNALLDLSALNAVTAYEPNELIITVQAGAPLADVLSLIDSKNQQFAFEPINISVLLGTANIGTIGGMIGGGLAGPRRIKAGGVRDHLLGAHAVSGFGDSFKTGGRVVKNVTGYDLCKLLAGSWGTLAVMTEVTLKVMPRPETERTLVLRGLDDIAANKAMTAALGSPFDVSAAAHVPNSAFRGSVAGPGDRLGDRPADLGSSGEAVTLLRLEGITASVAHRAAALVKALAPFAVAEIVEDAASAAIWSSVRDIKPFAAGGALGTWPVWRIVCPPASGGALGQALARDSGGDVIYDWGGGLIWAALPPKPDAQAALVRARVNAVGGHATLLRASDEVRRNVDVFHPQQGSLASLSERVRLSFDPKNILNRGRMIRGSAL